MASIALSGVASGIDTATIVSQLMQLERQGQTRVTYRQKHVEAQATGLKDIKSKLDALKSAATALRDVATWKENQTVESSDPARVAVTRTGGAPIGGTSIRVTQLASSAQKTYAWTESATASTLTLDDADPATDPVTVGIGANAKAADVAAAINGKAGSPVFAAVVSGKLVLSSRATGETADFSAAGGGLSAPEAETAGKDAKYFLENDPVEKSSPTNVVSNALAGVTLTFKATTTQPVGVTVGEPALDKSGITSKVKAFVEAYNAVVTLARGELSEKKVASPTSNTQAAQGALFGDGGVSGMLSKLRLQMSEDYTALGNATRLDDLADLGISSGKPGSSATQAKSGLLTFDEAKFSEALSSDSQAVRRLLGGAGTPAFAQDVEKLVDQFGDMIDSRVTTIDKQARRIGDDLTRAESRLAAQEKRLKAQFAAMESALGQSQTQQSWLTGQLNALNR
ncbi:MAG TPA: flagellar filament capping protein FliD [Solirubrobacteraceae bacterium]|nr:flagellar filament capping protein FliD [Solirubrobacteraceae bacterium]